MSSTFQYGIDHLTAGIALSLARGELRGELSDDRRSAVHKSHEDVLQIAAGDQAVYGINTGFGPLCNTRISKENTALLQKKLLLSHSVGVGEPIDKELSKLMLILKVHSLAKGLSGVSIEVMDRILWHIENDIIPIVPEQGSVGASGDLAPLAHLFLPLIGESFIWEDGSSIPSGEVLKRHGLDPLNLPPKSGLALINGTQFIAAHAVIVVERLHHCLDHADLISAMTIEGQMASAMPFHKDLHKARPHPGIAYVAYRMSELLKGSEINQAHAHCDRVQDPYSLRCVPQVHGSSRSAWLHLKEALEIEINSVTDNPVIFSKDFTISGGNFHGQPLALPLDYAAMAAAELGSISDRRTYLSLEGKAEGVPKLLMRDTGINSGFMILQYTSAALVSENKSLCFPASVDSIPTSLGQEDHVSMGSISGRKALRICTNLETILAIELICAGQALDFRRPLRSSEAIEAAHGLVREVINHASEDRIFGDDIQKARNLLRSGKLIRLSRNHSLTTSLPFEKEFDKY